MIHPPFEELNDLLDGRANQTDRRRIEEHLDACERCRAEWASLTATRESLRRSFETTENASESLRARIAATLDREERSKHFRGAARWAMGLAAAAVILWGVVVFQRREADLADAAVADYASIASGQRSLELLTSDTHRMESWFDQRLDFSSRVFDLAMMRYHLVGGRVDSMGTRRSALFVYRHELGEMVVCEMFLGRTEKLPRGAERRVHNGIDFLIYEREGVIAVFWQEGNVVCVLAGRVPREEVLSLAFAKAMRPTNA